MGLARPHLTREQLLEGKETLRDGHELFQSLPAVISDAKRASTADPTDPASDYYQQKLFDPTGYAKDLELAEKIRAAFEECKKTDEHGPHFVLAWRMYPNKDHPRWQERDGQHACGCGFGAVCPPEETHRARSADEGATQKSNGGKFATSAGLKKPADALLAEVE